MNVGAAGLTWQDGCSGTGAASLPGRVPLLDNGTAPTALGGTEVSHPDSQHRQTTLDRQTLSGPVCIYPDPGLRWTGGALLVNQPHCATPYHELWKIYHSPISPQGLIQ